MATAASKPFVVSESSIRTHKCCLCNHLLSVPPIMAAGLEDEMYKCGRCEQVKCQTYTRNRLFEDVAQHLSFPCSYHQCNKNMPWSKVEEHEKNCPHRTIKCPIYYHNCTDVLRVDKLKEHFTEKHSKNVKTTGANWDINTEFDYVFLTSTEDQHFFIYILHLDNIFSVAVLSVGKGKYTKFNVKLSPSTGDYAVSFDNLPIVRYDERLHCYMCIRKKCQEPHHPFSEKNKAMDMDLSDFAKKLKQELINSVKSNKGDLRYHITLTGEVVEPQHDDAEEEVQREEEEGAHVVDRIPPQVNVEALRKGFSCPYCMTYMAAPIYMCLTGHVVCNVCRPRLIKCPTCAGPFGESRNFILEEMAKEVGVPCQYDVKGCTFVGSASKMYIHEMECLFSNLLRE